MEKSIIVFLKEKGYNVKASDIQVLKSGPLTTIYGISNHEFAVQVVNDDLSDIRIINY